MKNIFGVIVLGAALSRSAALKSDPFAAPACIPRPMEMKLQTSSFIVDQQCILSVNSSKPELAALADYWQQWLSNTCSIKLTIVDEATTTKHKSIALTLINGANGSNQEAYQLSIKPDQVILQAATTAGLFYGLQTLKQLTGTQQQKLSWPCLEIVDQPRYAWRGMMLDCSRHFFPKEFIKKFIDYLAMFKFNRFHWHLTDDQGWRIEIKKYPNLTDVGAWRVDREQHHWNNRQPQQPGEKATYGGFYSQQDIREIVAYAQSRHITIVPEIEMPAHAVAALASYPQYSCSGGPFTVLPGSYWPISNIFCAGNDSTFEFIQNILSEVIELFPGEYIHIGGDEADKAQWKICSKCQERIRQEKLKDEAELQSYFIKRIEKFLAAKNRRLIGWDEILEGGLAPQATVMSWRGFEGGIAAAQSGHDVVMSPTSYCYFDYYQGRPDLEPLAIGGFLPVEKVYSFEPTPDTLNSERARHILGAQANLWTEFVPHPDHAEYMLFPRMLALSEVVWSPKNLRNWNDFAQRLLVNLDILQNQGIRFSESIFQVVPKLQADRKHKNLLLSLHSLSPAGEIHYTLDGTAPTTNSLKYGKPVTLKGTVSLQAALFRDGCMMAKPYSFAIMSHKAAGKKVVLTHPYSDRYPASGAGALVDGLRGSFSHTDSLWQGYHQDDLEAVIDLAKKQTLSSVSIRCLANNPSWIFLPQYVRFSFSNDGITFNNECEVESALVKQNGEIEIREYTKKFADQRARYIKVYAKNVGVCPPGHPGAGGRAWLFVDEIVVE